jgi:hypothetical protein
MVVRGSARRPAVALVTCRLVVDVPAVVWAAVVVRVPLMVRAAGVVAAMAIAAVAMMVPNAA